MSSFPVRRAIKRAALIEALLARDGPDCFLCGKALGDDITVEHMLAQVHGGPSHPANLVLTHRECNLSLGSLPVMLKVRARENLV